MTPRETALVFEAAAWRRDQERQRDTWLAWHVAALSRMQKLPSLKDILAPRPKPLTPAEKALRKAEHEELVARMVKRG